MEASQKIPFPTSKKTEITINDDVESFYIALNEFFGDSNLFQPVYDEDGNQIFEDGVPKIEINMDTPSLIDKFVQFIQFVNENGLKIKGENKDGSWNTSVEFEQEAENNKDATIFTLLNCPIEKVYKVLEQLENIATTHNLYTKTAPKMVKKAMTKNQCLYQMLEIIKSPSNQVEAMIGVDESTDPIKNSEYGAKSKIKTENGYVETPYANDDKHSAAGGDYTKHKSIQEGLVGKQCVGIGAVSIKVNSTCQYYMNILLNGEDEAAKQRILFPRLDKHGRPSKDSSDHRGYQIGGKWYTSLANLYDKSKELGQSLQQGEILEALAALESEEEIPLNVATSLAAMLSVAVDNAKDLALAKMNAGPKTFGFYAYGISLGIDIRELARIINSEQGRAITKMTEGNVFTGEFGAFSALQAIDKFDGKIGADLVAFDEPLIIKGKVTKVYNGTVVASKFLEEFIKPYYQKFLENLPKDQRSTNILKYVKGATNDKYELITKAELRNMVYQLAVTGKLRNIIDQIVSSAQFLQEINKISAEGDNNVEDWKADVYQLINWCNRYSDLQGTFRKGQFNKLGFRDNKSVTHDLYILAQGAEEMRILGSILSSNKGIKSKVDEGNTFISNIEDAIVNRKELLGLKPSDKDHIDFVSFVTDPDYRQLKIDEYEKVKHSINILDVVSVTPHFLSYLRACSVPYAAFKEASSKFRARDRYIETVEKELGLTRSKDKENAVKGIEDCVSFKILKKWLVKEQKMFILPKGAKYFDKRKEELIIADLPIKIPLWTDEGLATFKLFMESEVIPSMKKDVSFSDNQFVQGLSQFELSKTGTHATVPSYTLSGNLLPKTETELAQFLTFSADFASLINFKFPNGGDSETINNYQDAFYIYSQYVFGGKKGPRSLVSLFDGLKFTNLMQAHKDYIAYVDANEEIYMTPEERIWWCSPNGNIYNPASTYFYGHDKNIVGTRLMKKERSGTVENPETGEVVTKNTKYSISDKELKDTTTGRKYFVNPPADTNLAERTVNFSFGDFNADLVLDPENNFIRIAKIGGTSKTAKILRELLPKIGKDLKSIISREMVDGEMKTTINLDVYSKIIEKYEQIKKGECTDTLK